MLLNRHNDRKSRNCILNSKQSYSLQSERKHKKYFIWKILWFSLKKYFYEKKKNLT